MINVRYIVSRESDGSLPVKIGIFSWLSVDVSPKNLEIKKSPTDLLAPSNR